MRQPEPPLVVAVGDETTRGAGIPTLCCLASRWSKLSMSGGHSDWARGLELITGRGSLRRGKRRWEFPEPHEKSAGTSIIHAPDS